MSLLIIIIHLNERNFNKNNQAPPIHSFRLKEDLFEEMNKNNSDSQNSPNFKKLHFASKINNIKIAELLISTGADINAKDIVYLNLMLSLFMINILI